MVHVFKKNNNSSSLTADEFPHILMYMEAVPNSHNKISNGQ